MALDDYAKKAKAFLDNEKVRNALTSEKAEGPSDKLVNTAADAARKVTGGKHDEKIEKARDAADRAVGNE